MYVYVYIHIYEYSGMVTREDEGSLLAVAARRERGVVEDRAMNEYICISIFIYEYGRLMTREDEGGLLAVAARRHHLLHLPRILRTKMLTSFEQR